MYPGRLDEKGRLKLPVNFVQYLGSLPEKKLFVTSLDGRIAQIYPIAVWRENEKVFKNFRDNPKAARSVAFTASDLGADSEIDNQGRVLFNSQLRDALDLMGQALHLHFYRGHVEVLSEARYQERKQLAAQEASDNVDLLKQAGLE